MIFLKASTDEDQEKILKMIDRIFCDVVSTKQEGDFLVYELRKRTVGRPSPKDTYKEKIIELQNQGFTMTEIIKKLGIARSTAYWYLK